MIRLVLITALLLAPAAAFSEEGLLQYLQKKKAELDRKEERLNVKEKELLELEKEIDGKIRRYEAILADMEKILARLKKEKEERLMHIVQTYEKMDPAEAAVRLGELDEDMAVRIFAGMKARKSAKILAVMDPEKAARITGRIAEIPGLEKVIARMKKKEELF